MPTKFLHVCHSRSKLHLCPSHEPAPLPPPTTTTRCCTEFVDLVSSEANEKAEQSKKTMIQPEHIMAALEGLQFQAYLDEVAA
jgi:hypothetical protein